MPSTPLCEVSVTETEIYIFNGKALYHQKGSVGWGWKEQSWLDLSAQSLAYTLYAACGALGFISVWLWHHCYHFNSMMKLDWDWSLSCKTTITCVIIVHYNNTILSILHHRLFLSTLKSNSTLFLQHILSRHKPLMQFKTHFENRGRQIYSGVHMRLPVSCLFLWCHLFIFSLCNFPPLFASCAYYDRPADYLSDITQRQINRWCLRFFFILLYFSSFFYNRLPEERHQRE